MTYRIRNIAIAVGLALVAALLTTFYVAKRDIPQGTTGAELIKSGWIKTAEAVQRSVVPGAISNPDQVRNLITSQPIYTGEQVSLRRFAGHAEQGVRSLLHGTLRALSIPGTPDALLSGTLHDGDHVDVIANLKTGDCSTCFAVRNVARDVLVLRAAGTVGVSAPKPGDQNSSVLLAVHDNREAQKIWYAVENSAGWSLALRPVANASDSPEDIEGITSLLTDGASTGNAGHYIGSGK